MDENSLTIAILREIRDNTSKTNDRLDHLTGRVDHLTGRVDHLTERVDHLSDHVNAISAVQIRQEAILQRVEARLDLHGEAIKKLIAVTERIDARIDNLIDGPMARSVRDHEARIQRLERRET